MENYTGALKSLLVNISNTGFLNQMIKYDFKDMVYKDNYLLKFILEELKPGSDTKDLLLAYRSNLPEGDEDYSFEKELVIKYCDVNSPQNLYVSEVAISIPTKHILNDRDFIEKVSNNNNKYVFYKNKELLTELSKEDWYIDLLIKNSSIDLIGWQNFDFSNMERNLRIIESSPTNYEYFPPLEKVNPIILDCVLNQAAIIFNSNFFNLNTRWKFMQNIANAIEVFHNNKDYYNNIDIPLNSHTVTPANYKDIFVEFGVYYNKFQYSDEDYAKVINTRYKQIKNQWNKNMSIESSFIESLMGTTIVKERDFSILSAYSIFNNYVDLLNNNEKYKVNKTDVNLLKNIFSQVAKKNKLFKSGLTEFESKGFHLTCEQYRVDGGKEKVLSNLKILEPFFLEVLMSVEIPINKDVKTIKIKF